MALPPNWARYTTDDGKEYFHNAVTNTTQWDRPEWEGQAPESLSFHSGTSEVYQYRPSSTDLDVNPRPHEQDGRMVGMAGAPSGGVAAAGKVSMDSETAALNSPAVPGGNARGGAPSEGSSFASSLFGGLVDAANAEDTAERMSGVAGWALQQAQPYFAVSSDDVIRRVRLAMMPYPQTGAAFNATNEFRERPDFWGPFWVATTAVLCLAATGNFARLLADSDFEADYGLVVLAASLVYGCLAGVPLVAKVALYFGGGQGDHINFRQIICVYGYSLTPAIPMSVACMLPLWITRWLSVLAGLFISLAFIRGNLWTDLVIEAPSLKLKLFGLFVAAQATIFLVYRFHFLV